MTHELLRWADAIRDAAALTCDPMREELRRVEREMREAAMRANQRPEERDG